MPTPTPLILAIDTSSTSGSAALSRGASLIGQVAFEAVPSHSQRLLPAVSALFEAAGANIKDVDLFAVVVGPGSFTGLRVSLASIRGLAGTRPCFGALTTDVAAWAARGKSDTILAMTDLFHGEVFGSIHDREGIVVSESESGDLRPVLEALRRSVSGDLIATGSAAIKHRDEIAAAFPAASFLDLAEGLAPHLATLAAAKSQGATVSAGDLLPFYLRDPLTRGLLNTQPKER